MILTPMKGEEFIEELLRGRTYFVGIELEEGFDLVNNKGFKEVCERRHETVPGTFIYPAADNPIVLDHSIMKKLNAKGLQLPFIEAKGVNFEGSDLSEAYLACTELTGAVFNYAKLKRALLLNSRLQRAQFIGSDLEKALLTEANLSNANFQNAVLVRTSFEKAYLASADFTGAMFYETDFCGTMFFLDGRASVKGITKEMEERGAPYIIRDPNHPSVAWRKDISEAVESCFRC